MTDREPFFINANVSDRWHHEPVVPLTMRIARRLGLAPRPVHRDARTEGMLLFEFDGEDEILAKAAHGITTGLYRRGAFFVRRVIAPTAEAIAADPTLPTIVWEDDTIPNGWVEDEMDVVGSILASRIEGTDRGEGILRSLRGMASDHEDRKTARLDALMDGTMHDPMRMEAIIAGLRALASIRTERDRWRMDHPGAIDLQPQAIACSAPTPWLGARTGSAWGHGEDPWDRRWIMSEKTSIPCTDLPAAMPPCLVARVERHQEDEHGMTMIWLGPLRGAVVLDTDGIDPVTPLDPMETLRAIDALNREFAT